MKNLSSHKEFNELVKSGKPFLLDFYADWCGPCQTLLPTVDKLSKEFAGDVEVRKVDVDAQKDLAAKFNVRSIPALFFMKDNKVIDSHLGMASEHSLRKKLETLKKK